MRKKDRWSPWLVLQNEQRPVGDLVAVQQLHCCCLNWGQVWVWLARETEFSLGQRWPLSDIYKRHLRVKIKTQQSVKEEVIWKKMWPPTEAQAAHYCTFLLFFLLFRCCGPWNGIFNLLSPYLIIHHAESCSNRGDRDDRILQDLLEPAGCHA